MTRTLFAAVALIASPLAAETETTDPAAPPAADPVICKSMAVTGSRVKREKICMTASQWKEHRKGSQRYLQDMQRAAKNGTNGS